MSGVNPRKLEICELLKKILESLGETPGWLRTRVLSEHAKERAKGLWEWNDPMHKSLPTSSEVFRDACAARGESSARPPKLKLAKLIVEIITRTNHEYKGQAEDWLAAVKKFHEEERKKRVPSGPLTEQKTMGNERTAKGDFDWMTDVVPPPRPRQALTGAEDYITAVSGIVSTNRLLTICGPSGVGKTEIAKTVMAGYSFKFTGWQVFVEVEQGDSAVAIVQKLKNQILPKVEVSSRDDLVDLIGTYLANRLFLICLDNCEAAEDAVKEVVSALLLKCNQLSFLLTAPKPIGLDGEGFIQIERLETSAAETLFLNSVHPKELLNVDDAARWIKEIVNDGAGCIPRLVIAFARNVRATFALGEMVGAIRSEPKGGVLGQSDEAQIAMDKYSILWGLLSKNEKDSMLRISCLSANISNDLLRGVDGVKIDSCDELNKRHWLRYDPTSKRFSIDYMVAAFCQAQLGTADAAEARKVKEDVAHAVHRFTVESRPLHDHSQYANWLEEVDKELPSIISCLHFCVSLNDFDLLKTGAEILQSTWYAMRHRGKFEVVRTECQRFWESLEALGVEPRESHTAQAIAGLKADVLYYWMIALREKGDWEEALKHIKLLRELSRKSDRKEFRSAIARDLAALVLLDRNMNPEKALRQSRKARLLLESVDLHDPREEFTAAYQRVNFADCLWRTDNRTTAITEVEAAISEVEELAADGKIRATEIESFALGRLGQWQLESNKYDESFNSFLNCLRLRMRSGMTAGYRLPLVGMAVACARQDLDEFGKGIANSIRSCWGEPYFEIGWMKSMMDELNNKYALSSNWNVTGRKASEVANFWSVFYTAPGS